LHSDFGNALYFKLLGNGTRRAETCTSIRDKFAILPENSVIGGVLISVVE
jgi:hypothetical protein